MEQNTEPTVALSLTVKDTVRGLEFYTEALGAQELFRMPLPDGGVGYAELIKMIEEGKFRLAQMPSEPLSFLPRDNVFSMGFQ